MKQLIVSFFLVTALLGTVAFASAADSADDFAEAALICDLPHLKQMLDAG